jgi:hypothetical protein
MRRFVASASSRLRAKIDGQIDQSMHSAAVRQAEACRA